MQATVTRDIRRLAVGQVVYTAMCNDAGGMIDDATVYRLGPTTSGSSAATSTTASGCGSRRRGWACARGSSPRPTSCTTSPSRARPAASCCARSSGPRRRRRRSTSSTWFRFRVARIGGPQGIPIVVSRTGYTGELGYEVWCHPRDADRGLGRGLGGRRAARPAGAGPGRAGHGPDRGGADLRRLRVRRSGRPVRGGHRVHGRPEDDRRGLRRPRRARGAQGPPAAGAGRPGAGGQRDRRRTATACTSAASRSAS